MSTGITVTEKRYGCPCYMKGSQDNPAVETDSYIDANEQYSWLTIYFITSRLVLVYLRKETLRITAEFVSILDTLTQTSGIRLFVVFSSYFHR